LQDTTLHDRDFLSISGIILTHFKPLLYEAFVCFGPPDS